jgi:hypothetical protein
MRLRFSIRDLLWLTLVVALFIGWCGDHIHTEQIRRNNDALRMNIETVSTAARSHEDMDQQTIKELYRQLGIKLAEPGSSGGGYRTTASSILVHQHPALRCFLLVVRKRLLNFVHTYTSIARGRLCPCRQGRVSAIYCPGDGLPAVGLWQFGSFYKPPRTGWAGKLRGAEM